MIPATTIPAYLLIGALAGVAGTEIAHLFRKRHSPYTLADLEDAYVEGFQAGYSECERMDVIDIRERATEWAEQIMKEGL